MSAAPEITARDNALLVRLRRLARDGAAYRRLGIVWLEGEHLCRAALARGLPPLHALVSTSGWADARLRELVLAAPRRALLSDALFAGISALDSTAGIGFVLALPELPLAQPGVATVVLDRVQDAGNAGSIVRSAAAFGVAQVIALKGSVALWSPKVLRAGMGAHFALALIEGAGPTLLERLGVPLVATASHGGELLPEAALPQPCAWLFGNEGQGVASGLLARAAHRVRIPQPGGEDSLNVAAAAAVCLYEAARRSPR